MVNYIKNNFLQVFGLVASLGAILAAYNIFFIGKPVKSLEVVLGEPVPIVSISPDSAKDVEVFVGGNKAASAFVVQFQLRNSGNVPITSADFEKPLHVSIESGYKIAGARVISTSPNNLGLTATKVSDVAVELPKVLMNEGDSADVALTLFSATLQSSDPKLSFDCRVVGINKVDVVSKPSSNMQFKFWSMVIGWNLLVLGVIGVVVSLFLRRTQLGQKKLFELPAFFQKKKSVL
jgi:hypothetical protein